MQMEIITGVERRRRWRLEEKLRIVAEMERPPARALITSPVASSSEPAPVGEASRIEIALPDGTCIRVGEDIGLVALRRVMAAVRR